MDDRAGPSATYSRAERCTVIIVADPALATAARLAAGLIGGRVLQEIGWTDVEEALAGSASTPVLMIEAEGVAAGTLEAALPRIDSFATALDLPMVVAFAPAQLDLVAAALYGRNVQLLCAPSMAERVAALAVAAELATIPPLGDTWRESEATRLQRLNAEVARIADILARLTRNEPGDEIADRRSAYTAAPATSAAPIDPQEIRRTIRARRLRDQFFGAGLFEDPAWDMLLDLYAAELEHTRVSVSSLCIAAAVAPTTALRWISKMTEAGLFVRQPDPQDRRRAFMALSNDASDAMRAYLSALARAELAIA